MASANYYHLFALPPNATALEIKRRYRQLSLKYHPDRGGDAEKMVEINKAYRVLSNGLLRREYDRRIATAYTTASAYTHVQQSDPKATSVTSDFIYKHPTATQPNPQSKRRHSHFWAWTSAVAVLAFGFLAYQLYAVEQLSAAPATNTTTSENPINTPDTPNDPTTIYSNTDSTYPDAAAPRSTARHTRSFRSANY